MNAIERFRATQTMRPVDRLYRREFSIWPEAIAKWKKNEGMPDVDEAGQAKLFGYDEPAFAWIGMLGYCEPHFVPAMAEQVIQTTDEYEIIRDAAGRTLKVFKGRRHGFMPTYLKHAVECERDWDETIAPLLETGTPARLAELEKELGWIKDCYAKGMWLSQYIVGGYMYLRSLCGPEGICYMLVDNPGLVHRMMQRWLELAEWLTAIVQKHVEYDEVLLDEDICYNHGLLIAPDMVREFLLPYYRQLMAGMRRRQQRPVGLYLGTDGRTDDVTIEMYRSVGMTMLAPVEIAAGNDLLTLARKYPDLVLWGGIDKRVLAAGPKAIDEYLARIMPEMVRRGGYIPMCDHGVPDNVSYASYMHYRKRVMEMDH